MYVSFMYLSYWTRVLTNCQVMLPYVYDTYIRTYVCNNIFMHLHTHMCIHLYVPI